MSESDLASTESENRSDKAPQPSPESRANTEAGFSSQPTLKPVGIALGITVTVTAAIIGVLMANPTLFGTVEITQVVLWVVQLVGAFIVIRLLVRLYILSRMTYRVSEDGISREYSLLYRYRCREIPMRMVRGVEVSRDPIETLLGYGTVSILSGGTNQSLGFIEFEHIPDPERVVDAIETLEDDESRDRY